MNHLVSVGFDDPPREGHISLTTPRNINSDLQREGLICPAPMMGKGFNVLNAV